MTLANNNNNNIVYRNAPVRQHLKNVYGCLSLSTVSAAAGAYVHMYTQLLQANLLTTIGTLGLLIALMSTPDNGKNQKLRLGYLLGFAFLSGLGLGPLLELVVSIDPSIVMTALVGESIALIYPFFIHFMPIRLEIRQLSKVQVKLTWLKFYTRDYRFREQILN